MLKMHYAFIRKVFFPVDDTLPITSNFKGVLGDSDRTQIKFAARFSQAFWQEKVIWSYLAEGQKRSCKVF